MNPTVASIADKARRAEKISRSEAASLLPLFKTHLADLMATARMSLAESEPAPIVCGIINARSGGCGEDCAFCAQSRRRQGGEAVESNLLDEDELLRQADVAMGRGITHLSLVTAGRGLDDATVDRLCRAGAKIRVNADINLCASLGELTPDKARRLAEAGFTRYHHNLETSRSHFPQVCTTHTYDQRLATIANAKAAGLRVCSGGIFGIGESWADRLDFIEDLELADVDSIPVNFLIPISGTPCGELPVLSARDGLAILVMLRLLLPGRNVIMAAGRLEVLGQFANWIFLAGANGLMVGDFLTCPNNRPEVDRELLDLLGIGMQRS